MSGVWVFRNGVVRLVENPEAKGSQNKTKKKALVYKASGQVVTSYSQLEQFLNELGWERYYEDPDFYQFHKRSTIELITFPKDFSKFNSIHMYDIVIKNRHAFQVIDL